MKIISSTVLVALFAAVSQGRFLQSTLSPVAVSSTYGTTAFASTLNCGQCIGLGYNYCVQKAENTITNAYPSSSAQVCVNPTSTSAVSQYTDATYSCSDVFADRVYSKFVCTYNTAQCGAYENYTLSAIGSNATINITGLSLGQTCFYKVQAACGAASFLPNDTSKVEIEYVQFANSSLNASDPIVGYGTYSSNSTNHRQAEPQVGMPRRDHYFKAAQGANEVVNQNITAYNSSATNNTAWGVSGRYDKTTGGRKVWGAANQGVSYGNLTD